MLPWLQLRMRCTIYLLLADYAEHRSLTFDGVPKQRETKQQIFALKSRDPMPGLAPPCCFVCCRDSFTIGSTPLIPCILRHHLDWGSEQWDNTEEVSRTVLHVLWPLDCSSFHAAARTLCPSIRPNCTACNGLTSRSCFHCHKRRPLVLCQAPLVACGLWAAPASILRSLGCCQASASARV